MIVTEEQLDQIASEILERVDYMNESVSESAEKIKWMRIGALMSLMAISGEDWPKTQTLLEGGGSSR